MSYRHITETERYQIHVLLKAGHSLSEIAAALERHKSSISREIRRNTGQRGYRPKQAQEFAIERGLNSRIRYRISKATQKEIQRRLRQEHSPEQISGR